jgi:arylsulfatase
VWTLARVEKKSGRGELTLNGATVGVVDIPRIIRGFMPFNALNVGCDLIAPVATTYATPFRFSGTIDRIIVDILGREASPDAGVELRSEMGKQ